MSVKISRRILKIDFDFYRSTKVDEKHPDSRQSEQVSEAEMSTNDIAEALNEFFRSIDLDREELSELTDELVDNDDVDAATVNHNCPIIFINNLLLVYD